MSQTELSQTGFIAFIERVGKRIPDPIIIFIWFFIGALLLTAVMGGISFDTFGADGDPTQWQIKNMLAAENIVWLFEGSPQNSEKIVR